MSDKIEAEYCLLETTKPDDRFVKTWLLTDEYGRRADIIRHEYVADRDVEQRAALTVQVHGGDAVSLDAMWPLERAAAYAARALESQPVCVRWLANPRTDESYAEFDNCVVSLRFAGAMGGYDPRWRARVYESKPFEKHTAVWVPLGACSIRRARAWLLSQTHPQGVFSVSLVPRVGYDITWVKGSEWPGETSADVYHARLRDGSVLRLRPHEVRGTFIAELLVEKDGKLSSVADEILGMGSRFGGIDMTAAQSLAVQQTHTGGAFERRKSQMFPNHIWSCDGLSVGPFVAKLEDVRDGIHSSVIVFDYGGHRATIRRFQSQSEEECVRLAIEMLCLMAEAFGGMLTVK